MEKITVADLAIYQHIKQICTFGDILVDAEEFPQLAEWYDRMCDMSKKGTLKCNEQLDEIVERLVPPQPPTAGIEAFPQVSA